MKKGKFVFMACFVWLSLMFSANSSHAVSISNSKAIIYWDTLDISGIEIEWISISKGSGCGADAQDDWDYDDSWDRKDGWVDTSAFASVTNAKADAWTTDTELYEEVLARSTGPYGAGSSAAAWRWGGFIALETGDLTISVDYYLTQDLSTEYLGEWAEGEAAAGLHLYNEATGDSAEDWGHLYYNYVYDGGSDYSEDYGTLTVTLSFDEGQVGKLDADVNTVL